MVRLSHLLCSRGKNRSDELARCANVLQARGVSEASDVYVFFVPGRLEILGKHTDYAGGRSLTAATEQGFWFVVSPRIEPELSITDGRSDQHRRLYLAESANVAPDDWSLYPATVIDRLVRDFPRRWQGAEVVFDSTLPQAAGLSSSSALVVAVYLALSRVNRPEEDSKHGELFDSPFKLAEYLAAVESGRPFEGTEASPGVGTLGGSEDHTAILCSRRGQVGQFSYAPLDFERWIALQDDVVFAVASSGVVARKSAETKQAYNRLSLLAEAACDLWRRETGRSDVNLASIVGGRFDRYEQLERVLGSSDHPEFEPRQLVERCRQFYEESETIVESAGTALERQDWEEFGRLTEHSQDLAERMLSNQTEETSFLVRTARGQGAIASSAFGAGFGGSVWALVDATGADSLIARWASAYRDRFPERYEMAQFFATRPSGGARELFDGA